jgi:hypothetical protein
MANGEDGAAIPYALVERCLTSPPTESSSPLYPYRYRKVC